MAAGPISWAVAGRPLVGESVSGDACFVGPTAGGMLFAAIDGLGHGEAAHDASGCAVATLAAQPGLALAELFRRCHAALARTRGAVISLAAIDLATGTLSWAGVGNVEAYLVHRDPTQKADAIPLRGGIVGSVLPTVRVATRSLAPGDLLVFATDGIDSRFLAGVDPAADPETLAYGLLAAHGKPHDDALVLVARYLGAVGP